MPKPPVTTVELKQDRTLMSRALRVGVVHRTPDVDIPLGRYQLQILMGFYSASKPKRDERRVTLLSDYADYVCKMLVLAHKDPKGFTSYNPALRSLIGLSINDAGVIKYLVSNLKPSIQPHMWHDAE